VLIPVVVMAMGQLAGGLAWLSISGEDAPDLIASAPILAPSVLRAKIEAVLGMIALLGAPLVAVLAFEAPFAAVVTALGILIAAAAATSSNFGSVLRRGAASSAAGRCRRASPPLPRHFPRSLGPPPPRSPPARRGLPGCRR
jgi:hypothetical protein